jgi:hypothetical protein
MEPVLNRFSSLKLAPGSFVISAPAKRSVNKFFRIKELIESNLKKNITLESIAHQFILTLPI